MDWKYVLTSFQGRINRKPFWLGIIVMAVIAGVLEYVAGAFFATWEAGTEPGSYVMTSASPVAYLLYGVAIIISIWFGLALQIKRWHDRDKSGWWVLIGLVPVIGGIWALVETGFLRGTEGPNRFGPDPLSE